MNYILPIPQHYYSLLIICTTYNHEKYIEDALKGFIIQKTTFPYVALIIDDASTDQTANIIRKYEQEYPEIIKGVYLKENHYSKKMSKEPYIKPWKDKCKYVAFCEGDDYWIDPLKLQKQIDILETNPDVTFTYSNFKTVDENGNEINRPTYEKYIKKSYSGDIFPNLLRGNFILTLTTCFRKEILMSKEYEDANIPKIDYLLFLIASAKGKAIYIPEITGCYRKQSNGLMSSAQKWVTQNTLITFKYVSNLYIKKHIKQRATIDKFLIKTFIMRRAIGLYIQKDKELFSSIISIQKRNIVYIFPAVIEIILCKLQQFSNNILFKSK